MSFIFLALFGLFSHANDVGSLIGVWNGRVHLQQNGKEKDCYFELLITQPASAKDFLNVQGRCLDYKYNFSWGGLIPSENSSALEQSVSINCEYDRKNARRTCDGLEKIKISVDSESKRVYIFHTRLKDYSSDPIEQPEVEYEISGQLTQK